MKKLELAAFALAVAAFGSANAADITFQGAHSSAAAQTTAEGYRDTVQAAVAGSPLSSSFTTQILALVPGSKPMP